MGTVGSHEVESKGYVNTENSQMAFIGTIFTSTYHTIAKQLNSWPNSTASQGGELQLAVCLSREDGAI